MIKFIILNALLCSIMAAQTTIKIYNQGRALVKEERQKNFSQKGKQKLIISKIPHAAESSSINISSDDMEVLSKEYLYLPISDKYMLNANIGNEIELVKYGENGSITFSTKGKLISNVTNPIFEIDGKIVIDPPYDYRFSDIPNGISDYPYLNCIINNSIKQTSYYLSYITRGINWNAEYNFYLDSDKIGEIEGWYSIINDNNITYEDANISLVSGSINFETQAGNSIITKTMARTISNSGDSFSIQPEMRRSEEHVIFTVPEKINLANNSQIRHKFLSEDKVPYNSTYHISHSLNRYRKNAPAQSADIPVFVRYEIVAKNIGDFQIPGGNFNLYERKNDILTYIGVGSSGIVENDDKIYLETGKTHDILCTFIIQGYKINKDSGKAELNAIFENRKDKPVSISWTEKFSDGRWDITNSNIKFEKLDAYRALFTVDISPNSIKEIHFTAQIDKE